MICPPCRQAADAETDLLQADPAWQAFGHTPATCRDQAIQPSGCPCQHQAPTAGREPQGTE